MSKSLSRLLATMTCAASLNVYAAYVTEETYRDRPTQGKPHRPPQAAINACKAQAEKASCQFTGRNFNQNNETMTGICTTLQHTESDAVLAYRPEHKNEDNKDQADSLRTD